MNIFLDTRCMTSGFNLSGLVEDLKINGNKNQFKNYSVLNSNSQVKKFTIFL